MLQMGMSKLSLKILLSFMALMFSASVGLSAECEDDPNECTPKNLCEVATQVINDNTVWSEDASAAKHIAFVKELGMECGVVEITDPCDLDPNECKVKQLCEKATTGDDGSKSWNPEAEGYVKLAKEFKLGCGVVVKIDKVVGCKTSPGSCTDTQVCDMAVYEISSRPLWDHRSSPEFVSEAKKRFLRCGVKPSKSFCSEYRLTACTDYELCLLATRINNAGTVSTNAENKKAVKEAEKRGLSCGIGKKQIINKSCTLNDMSGCTKERLCKKAASKRDGIFTWKWNIFTKEARKRGLNCGVEGKSMKTCSPDRLQHCNTKALCYRANMYKSSIEFEPYRKEAQRRGLACVTTESLASYFKKQSLTKRKQIQYALKELGFYNMGIDGLWGNGTRKAFATYTDRVYVDSLNIPEAVRLLLEKVKVPSSFSTSKKSYSSSSSSKKPSFYVPSGWRLVTNNPQHSFEQANAICKPMSENAGASVKNFKLKSNSFNCFGNSFSVNCNENSGGFAEGFAESFVTGMNRKKARQRAFASCMAQYGWVEK